MSVFKKCKSSIKVKDNKNAWSDEVSLTLAISKKEEPIDKEKPAVKFTSLSNAAKIDKTEKTFTIKGTASAEDVKITKVQIRIDDGYWQDAEGTTTWSYEWDLTDVNIGKHTISIRAFDGESYSEIETIEVNIEKEKDVDVLDGKEEKKIEDIFKLYRCA